MAENPTKVGNYYLIAKIHEGMNFSVYHGQGIEDKKKVIIKIANNKFKYANTNYLRNEYNILAELTESNVENVIKSYEIVKEKETLAIVMEDIEGVRLAEYMTLHRLDLKEILELALTLCSAIGEIHKHSIIHKDINPSNIIINPQTKKIKIIDFSISTRSEVEEIQSTDIHSLEGTTTYMAPEQTGCMDRYIDYRSDYYSFGITLYQLLVGKPPFVKEDILELIHQQLAVTPIAPATIDATIPKSLSDIVMKLIEKNSEDRYQSINGIRLDLTRCLNDLKKYGDIKEFKIGEIDVKDKLQIHEKLYGRNKELTLINKVIDNANNKNPTLLIISGVAGSGKSSLVKKFSNLLLEKKSYFISSKFDEYQKNEPYYAIKNTLSQFIDQILSDTQENIDNFIQETKKVLGENVQPLIDLIPRLAKIFDKQPQQTVQSPTDEKNLFDLSIATFIKMISKDNFIILFLDDLQWADNASLALLQVIAANLTNEKFLFITSYREEEVTAAHPSWIAIEKLPSLFKSYFEIKLENLNTEAMIEMLSDAMTLERNAVAALVNSLYKKTNGNPFFTKQLLNTLCLDKKITFDYENNHWTWNIEEIDATDVTANVANFLQNIMSNYSDNDKKIINAAACIGQRFSLDVLADALDINAMILSKNINKFIQNGIILGVKYINDYSIGTTDSANTHELAHYRFTHDKVYEAAYLLLNSKHTQMMHLKIGSLLLSRFESGYTSVNEFMIVDHLNLTVQQITDANLINKLKQLNLSVGKHAMLSGAFQNAYNYFKTGLQLLDETAWTKDHQFTYDYYSKLAECAYITGKLSEATQVFNLLIDKSNSLIEKAYVYNNYIQLLVNTYKLDEALKLGDKALGLFHFKIPKKGRFNLSILANIITIKFRLRNKSREKLVNATLIKDESKKMILELLNSLVPIGYQTDPKLLIWLITSMMKICLKYGNSSISTYVYALYSLVVGPGMGDYAKSNTLAYVALDLNNKFNDSRFKCRVKFLVSCLVLPWTEHSEQNLKLIYEAYNDGIQAGDLIYCGICVHQLLLKQIVSGNNLGQLLQETAKYKEFILSTNDSVNIDIYTLFSQWANALMGATNATESLSDSTFNEESFFKKINDEKNLTKLGYYYVIKLCLCYINNKYDDAFNYATQARLYIKSILGTEIVSDFYYLAVCAYAQRYENASKKEKNNLRKIMRADLKLLKNWAEINEKSFAHKYLLALAEFNRVTANNAVADNYDKAIESALTYGYLMGASIANECAARYYLQQGKFKIAEVYINDALSCYSKWGSARKAEHIDAAYAESESASSHQQSNSLVTMTSTQASSLIINPEVSTHTLKKYLAYLTDVDVISILRSCMVLAENIDLETFLLNMAKILISSTGSTKCIVMWFIDNKPVPLVIAADDEIFTLIDPNKKPNIEIDYSKNILNYVITTGEYLIINNTSSDLHCQSDDYIKKNQIPSIMAFPIMRHDKMLGIVYLENKKLTNAYFVRRVTSLNLLIGQLSIALENALITKKYQQFVPHELLLMLNKENILNLILGDSVQKIMSVLFMDIREFTKISETLSADESYRFLNNYLAQVSPTIFKNKGFIDKYIGDAVLALFPEGADSAINASIQILRDLDIFNQPLLAAGKKPLTVGIGINTGTLMIGTVGFKSRMDITVISDAVNIAARVEELTKAYHTPILITEHTIMALKDWKKYHLRLVDFVYLRGKSNPIHIYEVFDADSEEQRILKEETKTLFEETLNIYAKGEYFLAKEYFENIVKHNPNDKVAAYHLASCIKKLKLFKINS